MTIKIVPCDNGYIVTRPHPMQDGILTEVFEVEEAWDDNESRLAQLEALRGVLYTIIEDMSVWNKHSKYNLFIVIRDMDTDQEVNS